MTDLRFGTNANFACLDFKGRESNIKARNPLRFRLKVTLSALCRQTNKAKMADLCFGTSAKLVCLDFKAGVSNY